MQIYILDISPLFAPQVYALFYAGATEKRRIKADALKQMEDKARCIGAGILLQKAYGLYRDTDNRELAFANSLGSCGGKTSGEGDVPQECTAENGKPYFAGAGSGQPYFNLSHSGVYAICAFSDACEVGLDIQRLQKKRNAVVSRVFHAREKEQLEEAERQGGEGEADRLFTQIWTQKEAMAKLTGEGIRQLLTDGKRESDVRVETFWLNEDYVWSAAQRADKGVEKVTILDKEEVFLC